MDFLSQGLLLVEIHLKWQNGKKHDGRLQIQGDNVENLELIDLQLEHVEWKGLKIKKLELIRCSFDQLNFSLSTALKSRFNECYLSGHRYFWKWKIRACHKRNFVVIYFFSCQGTCCTGR